MTKYIFVNIDFVMLKFCNIVISIPNFCICILIIKFYDEVALYGLK